MPPAHLSGMLRYCGASTIVSGQNKLTIGGSLAAVEGDTDTHGNAGNLIQQYGRRNFYINGKRLIVGPGDRALPDALGIIHPFAPTDPVQGYPKFTAYGGNAGGGTGLIVGGNLNLAELVKIGGQVIGQVKNFINHGNGTATVTLQNMGTQSPQSGQTLVGDETGNSLVLSDFTRSNLFDNANTAFDYTPTMEIAVCDDYGVVGDDTHFTGLPSQDYQIKGIVTI